MILIIEEREINWLIRPHCKISFKSYPFKFNIIHLLPIKALWHNYIIIHIQKTTTKITSRKTGTIKSISKLKCQFYINHCTRRTDITKIRTIWLNKFIIWAVILVIIKPWLKIWISEHSKVKIGLWRVWVWKRSVILFVHCGLTLWLAIYYKILWTCICIYRHISS